MTTHGAYSGVGAYFSKSFLRVGRGTCLGLGAQSIIYGISVFSCWSNIVRLHALKF